jgi:hypothetical protein
MNCAGNPDTSVSHTPKAIANWLSHHGALATTPAQPVTVGGLEGYVLSVHMTPSGGIRCGGPQPNVPLLDNVADPGGQFWIGSHSDHALIYLLNLDGWALGIMADSTRPQRPSLTTDASIIQHLQFSGT